MSELILTPGQVAESLGVSGTALRRAAVVYETTFGPLGKDARGARRWTSEAVERLRLAFNAVHSGRAASVEVALKLILKGDDLLSLIELPAPRTPAGEDVRALVRDEVRAAVREEVAAILAAPPRELPPALDLDELRAAIRSELHEVVRSEVRAALDPERLAVVLHAAPSSRPRGLLARLWRWIDSR